MAKGMKTCKVCGKEYEYCNTVTNDRFRWQDVACCKEHAMEYFALVAAARAGDTASVDKNEQIFASADEHDVKKINVEEKDEFEPMFELPRRKRK